MIQHQPAFIETHAKYIRIYYYDSSNLLYCGSHYLHAGNCWKKQGSFYYYFKECDVKLTAGGFIDDVKLVNRLRFRSRWANLAVDFRLDFYDHLRKNGRGRRVFLFWLGKSCRRWMANSQTHAANVRSFCSEMMKDFWNNVAKKFGRIFLDISQWKMRAHHFRSYLVHGDREGPSYLRSWSS